MPKPFKWYGGKSFMVPILEKIVPQNCNLYCEPYCGSAALFFRRRRVAREVLNDKDPKITNLFRVIQSDGYYELKRRLEMTPCALDEFRRAREVLHSDCPIDRAWAFFVLQGQIFCGVPSHKNSDGNWGRTSRVFNGEKTTQPGRWRSVIEKMDFYRQRLLRAVIEEIDGIDCIRKYDKPGSVFYVDPPYPLETRKKTALKKYLYDANEIDFLLLRDTLLRVQGKVILSTYWMNLWQSLIDSGWVAIKRKTSCMTGRQSHEEKSRTEYVIINPQAAVGMKPQQLAIFDEGIVHEETICMVWR